MYFSCASRASKACLSLVLYTVYVYLYIVYFKDGKV